MKTNIIRSVKIVLFLFLFGIYSYGQAPQKMSYQSVIRNNSNVLVANTNVGIKISILQGSVSGTVVYSETHTVLTNANGLASLEIGSGAIESGDFTTINWGNGTYYIKTETDPVGGTNYTISGTSQLLSVPYALHAKSAEKIDNQIFIRQTGIGGDSTLRNTWISDNSINITVPKTGKYLVNVNGGTNNLNQYLGLIAGGVYDGDCIMNVVKNGNYSLNIGGLSSKRVEYIAGGYQNVYYLNFEHSASDIVELTQGDVVSVQFYLVCSFSSPPSGIWYYHTSNLSLLKVGD